MVFEDFLGRDFRNSKMRTQGIEIHSYLLYKIALMPASPVPARVV